MSSNASNESLSQDPGTLSDSNHVADDAGVTASDHHVMELLSEHVPLSLLVDLSSPDGPASEEILQAEGVPENSWWVTDDGGGLGSVGQGLGEGAVADDDDDGGDGTSPR